MGIDIKTIQHLLELKNLGYFKNSSSVCEIGSQELHIKKNDLKELFEYASLPVNLIDKYPNMDIWPGQPRCSSKHLYKTLGFDKYQSIDINSEHGAIKHDLNIPFEDKSKFNKFDLVTDFGSCEHVFNVAECYKTIHKLTKPGGYIIINQEVVKGNGYFAFDKGILHGMAAANNYKIICTYYVITPGTKTKDGSLHTYLIPMAESLFNSIDFAKIRSVGVYALFQKQDDSDYKFPYQGSLMNEKYNHAGFNRIYFKDPLSYAYIPSANLITEEINFKILIKEFFRRLLNRIKF